MAENKKRILIVDDNLQNRKLEKDLLEVAGHTVLVAEDAETGIEIAKKEQPDFIIMDYQLPGIDGIEAMRVIKSDEKLKNIPCAIVTAAATSADIDKLKEAKCATIITKPINTRTFVKQVEESLHAIKK